MEHWHAPYLDLRHIPPELNEFELNTLFTFPSKERVLIDERRRDLYGLALALHLGFMRMTGRTLDAYRQIPKAHLGEQLGIAPPEIGTLRSLYDTRPRTLIDHQQLAYRALGIAAMTVYQRRYLVRWLKETLVGRPDTSTLLVQVKCWLYEHRFLIAHDRLLKRLIAEAIRSMKRTWRRRCRNRLAMPRSPSGADSSPRPKASTAACSNGCGRCR